MGAEYTTNWLSSLASTLEWWRDAGVETLEQDEPRDWLARPVAPAARAADAPAVAAEAPREELPPTLDAFVAWRLSESAPEAGWMSPLVAPDGPADAKFIILTDMPEMGDSARLMEGAAGRLLDRMLAAIGLTRDSVYVASLAVARPVTGILPIDQEARLVVLARHHLTLLAPERLLLFGKAAAKILPDGGEPGGYGLDDVNLFGGKTRLVASHPPRLLLERPAAKAEAWKHLLWLTRGNQ